MELKCPDVVSAIEFHPIQSMLAVALLNGSIELHSVTVSSSSRLASKKSLNGQPPSFSAEVDSVGDMKCHQAPCRVIRFFKNGEVLLSADTDGNSILWGVEARKFLWKKKTNKSPINSAKIISSSTFVTGDEDGCVKLWDLRSESKKPDVLINEYGEIINDFNYNENESYSLFATSGDVLLAYDIRRRACSLKAQSVPQGEDLTCIEEVYKGGRKLLCGNQAGSIEIFGGDNYGFPDELFPVYSLGIDSMVVIDDSLICLGCEDGGIRAVNCFPHRVVGTLAHHSQEKTPVENLSLDSSKKIIAACGHNNIVSFHSVAETYAMSREAAKEPKKDSKRKSKRRASCYSSLNEENSSKHRKGSFFEDL